MKAKTKVVVRDKKTGRFASAYKAKRFPKRFKRERSKEEIGGRTIEKVDFLYRSYADDGSLLDNFDTDRAVIAKDRTRKNSYTVTLKSYSGKGKISFFVNTKTGRVEQDEPYEIKD
jgi:hypothetical protein